MKKGSSVDIIISKMAPMKDMPPVRSARMPDARQSKDFIQEVDGDPKDMAEEMAAEEILTAIKQGDAKALVDALKNWHEICYGSGSDQFDTEEKSEGEY